MFTRASSTVCRRAKGSNNSLRVRQVRRMGGGGAPMQVSETHTFWGEAFGVFAWLWFFHRARHDLPVVLGFRHPWEHAEDPFAPNHHHHDHAEDSDHAMEAWDKFSSKAIIQKEVEEDDDEDDE